MILQVAQRSEKESRKVTLDAIWGHFWAQKLNIATLLKHCYLLYFQPKIQFWDHLMPSGTRAYGNLSACLATEAHFFVSFGLPAGLEGANWVSEGPRRPPKRDPKMTPNRSEIHPGIPWHAQGCQGVPPQVPPRLPTCIFMHIYAYFAHIYAYLCIFYAYLCMFSLVLCIFMQIVVHVIYVCA